ncbi:fungal specific transcription factor domain-containing protein [Aspergillus luchuensis]|uniref:Fungal specific transcription factor domain-containing protein n=1 Tax=Aspergillus kawachii TaxID=1069201 RepID=A0A146FZR9_ASPKA|nr:fungal specific transcription factor domain-containing protein [Aspergillus luchuensis]
MPTFPQIMRLPNDKQNAIDKENELAEARALLQARDRRQHFSDPSSMCGNDNSHIESEPHSHSRQLSSRIASTKAFLRISGIQDAIYPQPVFAQTPIKNPCQMQVSLLGEHIDAYFARCHPIYPFIHESTFRAQVVELVDRPSDDLWQMLLYAVAALGAFSISTERDDIDMALFEVAKKRFSDEMMEVGNVALVQALMLMSIYLRKRYRLNSGYNYLGLANRVAMGIGLYKEFHSSMSAPFFRETRRRLWWCLYTLNLEDSIAYSRPQGLPQSEIETEYPLNIHDLDLNPNTSSVTAEANDTTLYSILKFGAPFYFAVGKLYPRIISGPYPYAKELLNFDDSIIRHWESSLPSFFRTNTTQPSKYSFCHALLHWRCLNFRLLTFRPFVVWLYIMRYRNNPPKEPSNPTSVNTAINRCLKAAEESINTISEFWFSHDQNAITGWYVLDYIFTAALIPLMCLRYDSSSTQAASWQFQARTAVSVIESIIPFNKSASHCVNILESLYKNCNCPEKDQNHSASDSAIYLENSLPVQTPGLESIFLVTPEIL